MVVVLLVTEVAGQRLSSLRMLFVVVEGLGWVVFLEVSSHGSHHRKIIVVVVLHVAGHCRRHERRGCVWVCVCVCVNNALLDTIVKR